MVGYSRDGAVIDLATKMINKNLSDYGMVADVLQLTMIKNGRENPPFRCDSDIVEGVAIWHEHSHKSSVNLDAMCVVSLNGKTRPIVLAGFIRG